MGRGVRSGVAVVALLALVLVTAGCGEEPGTVSTDTLPKESEIPTLSIEEAAAAPGQTVRVEGRFVAPARGVYRLCDEWEQDDPPQCAEPNLIVQAIDPAAVEGLVTEDFPPRGEVTYSEGTVTLQGSVTGGVLLIDPTTPESGVAGNPENPSGTTASTTSEG
jgi:hypothetical protein